MIIKSTELFHWKCYNKDPNRVMFFYDLGSAYNITRLPDHIKLLSQLSWQSRRFEKTDTGKMILTDWRTWRDLTGIDSPAGCFRYTEDLYVAKYEMVGSQKHCVPKIQHKWIVEIFQSNKDFQDTK